MRTVYLDLARVLRTARANEINSKTVKNTGNSKKRIRLAGLDGGNYAGFVSKTITTQNTFRSERTFIRHNNISATRTY